MNREDKLTAIPIETTKEFCGLCFADVMPCVIICYANNNGANIYDYGRDLQLALPGLTQTLSRRRILSLLQQMAEEIETEPEGNYRRNVLITVDGSEHSKRAFKRK